MRRWPTMLFLGVMAGAAPARAAEPTTLYRGMCEASAVILLPDGQIVVADDDSNLLRHYPASGDASGIAAAYALDLPNDFLRVDPNARPNRRKADIEGAAWLDGRVFWIGSHSRSNDGDFRTSRHQFFATVPVPGSGGGPVRLRPDGRSASLLEPLRTALGGLLRDVRPPDLADPIGGTGDDRERSPKRHGLSIEGLAARPHGRSFLIALRSPLRDGRAILVPFDNPLAVVDGGAAPSLGTPFTLDLGGRGFRDVVYVPERREYLIIAGPVNDEQENRRGFDLLTWTGHAGDVPQPVPGTAAFSGLGTRFHPEAVVVTGPGGRHAQVLSDEGEGCGEGFRSIVLPLPPARG